MKKKYYLSWLIALIAVVAFSVTGCSADGTDSENATSSESISNSESDSGINHEELDFSTDPYEGVSETEFYANYKPAVCLADALYRSQHGFLSGCLEVPGQAAVDGNGNEVMRIYKGGAYTTLEEVAAYMYAFGGSSDNLPANYTSKKNVSPKHSIWGEYLRLNHSYFIGNTNKYPYEPELPNISGCGGDLQYYEMDIGTTGTTTPGYVLMYQQNMRNGNVKVKLRI